MKTLKFKLLSIFFDEFEVLTIDTECSIKVIACSCIHNSNTHFPNSES